VLVLLAGAGPFEGSYREEVRALGCDDMVRFLGFRRDIADLMVAADLVVVPSVAEAFGLVLAEALYLGRPVVATRAGGIPEIIDDGIDGVLVEPGDSAALARAIGSMLNDPERCRLMAGRGRERVAARFSFEGMTRAYESLYQSLLEQKR
jgi:glycosyltransferase involved in cell wall biosynthesis